MAAQNGPNGRASRPGPGSILERVRCHPSRYGRAGQALVETAMLFPLLMLLVMGSADLGRVFYYSIAVTNAAREGARQGTYYDPASNSNSFDSYAAVLQAVQREVPSDVTLQLPTSAPQHCLAGAPSSWAPYYPTLGNTGYVFICFDDNETKSTAAQNTIQVLILYNFAPVTPLAQFVGMTSIHVEAQTTMQVQAQP